MMDNAHLERLLNEEWEDDLGKEVEAADEALLSERVWKRIKGRTSKKGVSITFYKLTAVAALLAVAVLTGFVISLQERASSITRGSFTVTTNAGEHATAVLPDGSNVMLNAGSTLTYNPASFNQKSRIVSFTGEGYFDIAKSNGTPFTIQAGDVDIHVKGTKFNLKSRSSLPTIELMLDEGAVEMADLRNGRKFSLQPGEYGTYVKGSGMFVRRTENGGVVSSWRKGEMVFHSTPIGQVIASIEEQYGIGIELKFAIDTNEETITGTFTTHNLMETLDMIGVCYNARYTVNAKTVVFYKR